MAFNSADLPYISPIERELSGKPKPTLRLTPFNIQRVLFNLVTLHWTNDNPSLNGYTFDQRYTPNDSDSSVFIDMALNKKLNPADKKPSIIISRSDGNYNSPVMNQMIGVDPREGVVEKVHIITCGLTISCIAEPVGLVEQIADWTAEPLTEYEELIRKDFKLRRFRMSTITRPQQYKDIKDYMLINIQMETVFDSNVRITEDSLKLKTISRDIFLGLNNNPPLEGQ